MHTNSNVIQLSTLGSLPHSYSCAHVYVRGLYEGALPIHMVARADLCSSYRLIVLSSYRLIVLSTSLDIVSSSYRLIVLSSYRLIWILSTSGLWHAMSTQSRSLKVFDMLCQHMVIDMLCQHLVFDMLCQHRVRVSRSLTCYVNIWSLTYYVTS